MAKAPEDRFQSMADLQAALRGHAGRTGPIHLTPPVGSTAILMEQQAGNSQRMRMGFDQTMATPAPVSITPGVYQPGPVPRVAAAATAPKQTTTFRNAAGETTDLDFAPRSKRRIVIATASIVGLAAAGLLVTLLVTRPSPGKPAGSEPAAAVPTAAPVIEPMPEPKFTPPPPAAAVEPPPVPPPTPVRPAEDPAKSRKKNLAGKAKKLSDQPGGNPTERPTPPAAPPAATPGGRLNTERW